MDLNAILNKAIQNLQEDDIAYYTNEAPALNDLVQQRQTDPDNIRRVQAVNKFLNDAGDAVSTGGKILAANAKDLAAEAGDKWEYFKKNYVTTPDYAIQQTAQAQETQPESPVDNQLKAQTQDKSVPNQQGKGQENPSNMKAAMDWAKANPALAAGVPAALLAGAGALALRRRQLAARGK